MKIYKPSMEDFVAEALLGAVERPVVYLQTHVETESDERRQPDGSLLVTPVNAVSVLATTWNREGRVIAWQIEQEMKAQNLNKTMMAKKMHTSRAALNRLLDENDTSLTLTTLASAAAVLGKTLKVELMPA